MTLTPGPSRRRGAALEGALLDAAWAELADVGYAAMTYEGVAVRAGTSRPVIYRRWPAKAQLTEAALRHYYDQHPLQIPDTGSLRGDVIALLERMAAERTDVVAVLTVRLSAYLEETRTHLADLRNLLTKKSDPAMAPILARAAARGEIATPLVSPRVSAVPIDLLRNELLFGPPIGRAAIESIVDEAFLPLLRQPSKTRRTDGG